MVTFDRACSIFAVGRKVGGISFFTVFSEKYTAFFLKKFTSRTAALIFFSGQLTFRLLSGII